MKTAFITGILGQDGPYLAKLLLQKGYKVYGLIRRYTNPNFENLDFLGITNQLDYVMGDMIDEASLSNLIRTLKPDEVYNLAAQSFVGSSWDLAMMTTEVNAVGTLRLLNAVKMHSPHSKFYQASTSEMFGNSHNHGVQDEETVFKPRSPYAIAKLHAYWMTINYRESYGLFAANGILFNHESPLRGPEFVSRKITKAVAAIAAGKQKQIALGNLDAKRDWGFAGDYVEAMWQMLQQPRPDDYVIATGRSHSIRELLDVAFQHVGISDWTPFVVVDPRYKRPNDLDALRGNPAKAGQVLGWRAKMQFEELIKNMVDADLTRIKSH